MDNNSKIFFAAIENLLNETIGTPGGTLALVEILKRFAGTRVYISGVTEEYRSWRTRQIKAAHSEGANVNDLANKFGIHLSTVWRAINEG